MIKIVQTSEFKIKEVSSIIAKLPKHFTITLLQQGYEIYTESKSITDIVTTEFIAIRKCLCQFLNE